MTVFDVYDVFTGRAFGGNQLAVIPDASALDEADLQRIAREFNFSETTFVFPPKVPDNQARVRIFTPTTEIAFAGHPTIGTAIALAARGAPEKMVLELGVGPIPCEVSGASAAFTIAAPLKRMATPDPTLIADALGLPLTAIRTQTHKPVQASLGLPFVIVELTERSHLTACNPAIDKIKKAASQYPAGLDFAIYAYVRNGHGIDARMFAQLANIPEDPATGSAAATLCALLTETLNTEMDLKIAQGDDMGRPSRIGAKSIVQDPVPVTISGSAVKTMEGHLVF